MKQVFLLVCLGAIGFYFYKREHPPILDHCEFALEHLLLSPSTLDIISTDVDIVYKKEVTIIYDAANAYGAPIRSTIECRAGEGRMKKIASIRMGGDQISNSILFDINYALYSKELKKL